MEKTTLQLNVETLNRLKFLKNFERQSYDDVLNITWHNYGTNDIINLYYLMSNWLIIIVSKVYHN